MHEVGFSRVTQSTIINEGKTWLYGFHIEPSTANPRFSLYEGLDANSGRLVMTSTDYDVYTAGQNFSYPRFLDRGLTVVITSGVTAVTLFWEPVREEV